MEFRLRRRRIFERDDPPPFNAIVHEAALRMRFGGREVAKGQLEYLLEASEWPTVTVRVIPFTNEHFIEVSSPLLYAGGVVPQLDTAQIDTPVSNHFKGANCVEVARFEGHLLLRESDDPDTVMATMPAGLTALVRWQKSRRTDDRG
ncbi:Scr1 family TA system antitoxin-like transcriptional regulator [Streptomyces venezuelae]|uniref:DUF397 domain-containing protein n=1 Tax=Streptomyces sp. SID337 TaxID=2690262 RepID=UPI00136DE4F4|nr:Scr1 family TA system antitoxin-like transcriptional regulator [Streptomyces venezuelae]MYY83423.1 DUF397 domain-containing protein [Streptomyces sp. SID335]MYZ14737.1 DUF397 domain-containing protein [Streptomyces sp. SID337]NDZ92132.1 DUF397 domain-containing protein [Streptomyces sp. SID10115]NEA01282.1 DUF397 domain-containing protein [Streptomyces sp. SID10116]NEB43068.1 DUF397 domain-containing protein [Streptomyces sp. SID339]